MRISKSKHILVTAASALCLTVSGAPNIGEALKQSPAPTNQQAGKVDFSLPTIAQPPTTRATSTDFLLSKIVVEGATSVPLSELSALFSQATGRRSSLSELNGICTKITDLYRRKGYFLSRAYVPQQEVKDGVVVLKVIEARLSEIKLTNSSLANDDAILSRLSVAEVNAQISEKSIGHALAATAELAGVQISRATVEPGATTGSTNLLITAIDKPRWTGSIYLDNNGALYTGRSRAGLSATWASPSEAGDTLSFNAITTTSAGLTSGYLRYERPILVSSSLFAQLSQTDYKLGGTYAPLNAHGNALTAEIGFAHTLSQDLTHKLSTSIGIGHRDIEDLIDSSGSSNPKKDDFLSLALDYRKTINRSARNAFANLSAKATTGHLGFKDSSSLLQDTLGSNTQGNYSKLELSADYTHPILTDCSLTGTIKNQFTINSKNLDGSQKIGVSGQEGLRAFSSSELLGDNGLFAQLSFGFPIAANNGFSITGAIFAEYGRVSGGDINSQVTTRNLSDYGVEAQLSKGSWFLSVCAAFGSSKATIAEPAKSCKLTFKASKHF